MSNVEIKLSEQGALQQIADQYGLTVAEVLLAVEQECEKRARAQKERRQSCNLHQDCAAAAAKAKEANKRVSHWYDDCGDECFGH